jgi:hypothetical protein
MGIVRIVARVVKKVMQNFSSDKAGDAISKKRKRGENNKGVAPEELKNRLVADASACTEEDFSA